MAERLRMTGSLTISMARPILLLIPLMRLTGILFPTTGKYPALVDFQTNIHNSKCHLIRYVQTPTKQLIFASHSMRRGDEIIEVVGRFCCWRALYSWDGKHVSLKHNGYAIKLGRFIINLPLNWLFGKTNAQETPLDNDSFAMYVSITHRFWGELYRYQGIFTLKAII